MRKNHTLTFNDISLIDYQCFYDGSQLWRKPERLVEKCSVIGRNGDLIIDQGAYSKLTGNIDGDAKQLLITYFSNNQKKISSNLAQIKLKADECKNIPNGAKIYNDFVKSKVEQALLVA